LRKHHKISNGYVWRSCKHPEASFRYIIRAQSFVLGHALLDFSRIANAPQFVQHCAWGHGADADVMRRDLTPNSMNESLNCVFGGAVNWLPMNHLMARD